MLAGPIVQMPNPSDYLDNWQYWNALDRYYAETGSGGSTSAYGAQYGTMADFSSTGGGGASSGFTLDVGSLFGDLFGGGGGSSQPDVKQILTSIANSAEAALKQNLGAWQAQQITSDSAKLNGWAILDQAVQKMVAYGAQGVKSAAERDRRIDASQLKWDWIAYYIDPITGSTVGQSQLPSTVASATGSNGTGSISGTPQPYTNAQPFVIPGWVVLGVIGLVVWKVAKRG